MELLLKTLLSLLVVCVVVPLGYLFWASFYNILIFLNAPQAITNLWAAGMVLVVLGVCAVAVFDIIYD
jgi:hypothetical protein